MKRSPLKRSTPLRAKKSGTRSGKRTKYASRPRHVEYMLWVKTLPCAVVTAMWCSDSELQDPQLLATLALLRRHLTPCHGEIEADHMGERALSRKAHDSTCAPLCTQHHRERTDHAGMFRNIDRQYLRAFTSLAIRTTQATARARGVEVPE